MGDDRINMTPLQSVTKRLSAEGNAAPAAGEGEGDGKPAREPGADPEGSDPNKTGRAVEGEGVGGDDGEGDAAFEHDGRRYGKADIERLIKTEASFGERETKIRRVATALQKKIDAFEAAQAGRGREPAKEDPPFEYDPDDTPTYGDLEKVMGRALKQMEKRLGEQFGKSVETRVQSLVGAQFMDAVEEEVEEAAERSEFLKASDDDRDAFFDLTMSRIFKREEEFGQMSRRDALKLIRRITSETEGYLQNKAGVRKVARAEEKAKLGTRVSPAPKSGVSAQAAQPRVRSMDDFRNRLAEISRRHRSGAGA